MRQNGSTTFDGRNPCAMQRVFNQKAYVPDHGFVVGLFCLTCGPGGYWRGAGLGLAGGMAGVRVWSAGAGMLMVLSGAWAC